MSIENYRLGGRQFSRSIDAANRALLGEKQPTLRFIRADDIAGALLFLLSPAGDKMTGSCLTLDRG